MNPKSRRGIALEKVTDIRPTLRPPRSARRAAQSLLPSDYHCSSASPRRSSNGCSLMVGGHAMHPPISKRQAFWFTSFTNVSDEITGAKKLLIRSIAAASCSGFWQPQASPMTIGK